MAIYDEGVDPRNGAARAGVLVNYAGAAVSLALIAGIGVWGYQLIVRDVSGIPVVRAMAGDMRVAPENPGGEIATHAGLSVNEVAAVGEAAAPEDRLVLAPETPGLAAEDLQVQPTAEAGEVLAVDVTPDVTAQPAALTDVASAEVAEAPLTANEVLALADQIAGTAAPLSALQETEVVPAAAPTSQVIAASVPGVILSPRPSVRPRGLVPVSAPVATSAPATAQAAAVTAPSNEVAVSSQTFAPGTKLVQLGAFPSPDGAAEEWTKVAGRFGQLMTGKDRVIQVATSGGRTFYRLRAAGFTDLNDARRFCAALVAENADCIPVVVR